MTTAGATRADGAAHGISVALLRPLAELLGRLGTDPIAFLQPLGIDDATAPDTYVAAELVDQQLDAIASLRNDPAFALTLAQTSLVRPLGLFGHMVWLSGTIRDALTRAVKFYGMVTRRSTITLEEANGIATVRQRSLPAHGGKVARGRILTEFPFASLALRARAATANQFRLRAVRFEHAADPHPGYLEVFGVPVDFGAAANELELDARLLELPLASADPITSAALEEKIAQLTQHASGRSVFLDRVRRAAAAHLDAPSPVAIARELGSSERTLRRRLAEEGSTLRTLVDDVRRARADELLSAGTPIKEIAFALGFSEPSAFSRAYKRWTGHAPRIASPR